MRTRAHRAALLAVALAACTPAVGRRANIPADAAAADSVRGIIERIGSDPTTQLVVRQSDGVVCALHLIGSPPIEGLEVELWGRRDDASATMIPGVACTFAAARYAVRAVDGVAAVDGILRADGPASAIETADGVRRPLRDVPSLLRTQAGARIYWAGPLDRAPAAYGVLAPAP
ncbi:MAG: hypothetical protein Q8K55_01855 [Gemmatimonadaceae bacterium]|nr:hypothetical protein [Gemmatimonadaceae bacterium]